MGDVLKNFDLLKRIVALSGTDGSLPVDITRLTKIIREEIPQVLEKQAPPNFPELYFDFEQIYGQFHDFLLFDKLIGKNIVALGGSFSSGKSTFLNSLLGKSVLPANIDPSTSVPTYVINGETETAWGINEFDVKLPLTFDDIKSIAHGFGDNTSDEPASEDSTDGGITLGHLLKSVFVSATEMPYHNIAFLDTPGYSKPDSDSYSAKTDERIAHAQLNSSNYILWFVPADAGTITESDVEFLDSLDKSIPKLIVITKADKAPNETALENLKGKIKSVLDVKGISYEDVLAFSRKKGSAYDRKSIENFLQNLNGARQEVDFARSFKGLFLECRKYYDEELKNEERKLSRFNHALTLEDNAEVRECLDEVALDTKDNIRTLKGLRDKLNVLKNDFFTELKKVADQVQIKMPEPSEIDLLEDHIQNPAIVLKSILQKKGRRTNEELIIGKLKNTNARWPYTNVKKTDNLYSIEKLIKGAKSNLLDQGEHILIHSKDNYLKRAYVVLLMSISQINMKSTNSLLYPCRLAVSCGMKSDIYELLKESMIIGENDFCNYAKIISAKDFRDIFIFDALSMVCIHDSGDEKKFGYIAGLATLFDIAKGELSEILHLSTFLLGSKDTLDCNFQYIDINTFLTKIIEARYKFEKNLSYETPTELFISYSRITDLTGKLPLRIYGKRNVVISNVYIHGGNPTLQIENCKDVIIEKSTFAQMSYSKIRNGRGLFYFNNIQNINIRRCRFSNLQANIEDSSQLSQKKFSLLGYFANFNIILFENCWFTDCKYKYLNYNNTFGSEKITTHFTLTSHTLSDVCREVQCNYRNSPPLFYKKVMLFNDTESIIEHIYCVPAGEDDWGNDILRNYGALDCHESIEFIIPPNTRYCDIRLDFRHDDNDVDWEYDDDMSHVIIHIRNQADDYVYWEDIDTENIHVMTLVPNGDGYRLNWE